MNIIIKKQIQLATRSRRLTKVVEEPRTIIGVPRKECETLCLYDWYHEYVLPAIHAIELEPIFIHSRNNNIQCTGIVKNLENTYLNNRPLVKEELTNQQQQQVCRSAHFKCDCGLMEILVEEKMNAPSDVNYPPADKTSSDPTHKYYYMPIDWLSNNGHGMESERMYVRDTLNKWKMYTDRRQCNQRCLMNHLKSCDQTSMPVSCIESLENGSNYFRSGGNIKRENIWSCQCGLSKSRAVSYYLYTYMKEDLKQARARYAKESSKSQLEII
jgi:hypothetical protein